ncbi:MAG: hypothetical protein A2138_04080 [Deltaproteobacteria bacterium RBG_16_71_12]|nr:MAG: hypothetical protein A2138_04080 [Deltaproteobacteria bacterium RBG_16_71_12]
MRAALGAELVRMTLFGSRARGEGHEESDLDVLVVVRRSSRALRYAVLDVAADVEADSGLALSPVVMDEEALARSFPLRGAVERDGVPL